MTVQTSVTRSPVLGVPGQLFDGDSGTDIVSKVATEDIPFGAVVAFTGDEGCKLPAASTDITGPALGGVALLDPTKASQVGYKTGDVVAVLRKGRVHVATENAATTLTTPHVRYVAGTGAKGGIRGTTQASETAQSVGLVVYKGNGAAGAAVLEVNLPGASS